MRFINSNINTFSKQKEGSYVPNGEVAEPGEIVEPGQSATKPAPDGATVSSIKSGDDVGRGREPERKPLPTSRIKLMCESGGVSAGSNPSKSHETPKSENGVSETPKTPILLFVPPCTMLFQDSHGSLDTWAVPDRDGHPDLPALSPRHSPDR